jgi:predicted ATP-binding protein involved in virulence
MKIRKLQLKNIGVFDDETIEFQECPAKDKAEIHILTGENGSGKTTILMALASIFNPYRNAIRSNFHNALPYFVRQDDLNSFSKRFHYISEIENLSLKLNSFVNIHCDIPSSGFLHSATYLYIDNQTSKIVVRDERGDLSSYRSSFGYKTNTDFSAFAYSGYRRIRDEKINLFDKIEEHPLEKALDFVKEENSKFTINQWLGRNLSRRALAAEDKSEIANKFTENIQNLEKAISEIVGYEIRFKLKTDLSLVLIKNEQELDFDVLPDGLKSLISWIGDLLMRLDSLNWKDNTPIFDREIILFLDEIEVHLHPAWQRKVLPIVQKLFKNAQIFVSTHSPFVVNSVDDAWVYELEVKDGNAKVREVTKSNTAYSIQTVLREVFGIDEKFGEGTQEKLVVFLDKSKLIQRNNGKSEINKDDFLNLAVDLAEKSAEFQSIVFVELAKITQKTGEPYEI